MLKIVCLKTSNAEEIGILFLGNVWRLIKEILTISTMKIQSPAFLHEGEIPKRYTVEGDNISPPLTFSDIPTNARTLALLVDDPDVPKSIRPD